MDDKIIVDLGDYGEQLQTSLNDFTLPPKQIKSIDAYSSAVATLPTLDEQDGYKALEFNPGKNIAVQSAFNFNGITTAKEITPLEQSATDGIINLMKQGQILFTPSQIYLEYRGTPAGTKRRVSQEEQQKVIEMIDRLRHIPVDLDLTELLAANGVQDYKKGKLEGEPWLNLRKYRFSQNNQYGEQDLIVYELKSEPIVYQYQKALARGKEEHLQQITYNKKLLNIPRLRQTDARVLIGRLLIEHIELLKNENNNYSQPTIKLERIQKTLTADCPNTSTRTVRRITEEFLEYYKNVEKFIDSYTKNKKGKNIVSYTIYPNKDYKG